MEKLIIKKQIIFRNIARILRALDLSFMKIVLSKVKYFIAGLFIITAISIVLIAFMSGDLKHEGQDFSADIRHDGDRILSSLEAEDAEIGFSIAAPNAKKSFDGKATVYKLDDKTSLKYEVLEEGVMRGLKETIILSGPSAPTEYSFDLALEGVKEYHPDPEDRSWRFYNDRGEEAFYIPAGFMVDAKGVRSEEVNIGISREDEDIVVKVAADKDWLLRPDRAWPVEIDPSVIVAADSGRANSEIATGNIAASDIQYGGLQRKIVKANGSWYAFYSDDNTGQDAFYKKCLESTYCDEDSDWGSRIDLDSSDADNHNPSIWLEDSLIYVAWIDDGSDAVEVNTINTSAADTLGTKCTSADQGTLDSTNMVSIAVADDGTVYFAYSDTSSDTEYGTFMLDFSGCTFTQIDTISNLDAVSADEPTAGSSTSWTHTTSTDANFLIVQTSIAATDPETVTGVTYNGDSLTFLDSESFVTFGADVVLETWYMVNPDAGTNTVSVTFSGSGSDVSGGASSWKYINTADPVGTPTSTNGTTSTASVDVSSATNEIVIDGVFSIISNPTPGANQALLWNDGEGMSSSYETATGATTTMSWSSTSSFGWALTGVSINPSTLINSSSGLTAGDRPVLVTIGNTLHMTYQDGNLSHSMYDGYQWISTNNTIAAIADNNYSVTTDGSTLWSLSASGTTATNFYGFTPPSSPIVDIDTTSGPNFFGEADEVSMYCPEDDNCKLFYFDDVDQDVSFVDCENPSCSLYTVTDIDTDVGAEGATAIHCPTSDNCKLVYFDDTDNDTTFVDCGNETCSTSTIIDLDTAPGNTADMDIYCVAANDCKIIDSGGTDVLFTDCDNETCSVRNTNVIDASTDIDFFQETSVSIYCVASDNCKATYTDDAADEIFFVDCANNACSSRTITTIDSDSIDDAKADVFCLSDTDCKISYFDPGTGDENTGDITFIDCDNATCSSSTVTDLDTDAGATGAAHLDCPSTTDCKVIYQDATSSTLNFVNCDSADCSSNTNTVFSLFATAESNAVIHCFSGSNCKVFYLHVFEGDNSFRACNDANCTFSFASSSLTAPWTGQTAVEGVSITYDSTNNDLWAHIIKDSSDQAYYKTTDASSISWSGETSYAFTAGTLNEISAPMTAAGSEEIGVVINQGPNYEANIPYDMNIESTDTQFGSLQRKLTYANGNYYAFYSDLGVVYYKKSADGSTWGSAVTVDSSEGDFDNYNPSVWLEGNDIYVAWIDDSADAIEVNTIETDNLDTLGTKCTSASQGSIGSSFTVSVAVADNGVVYAAYSDTGTDTEAAVYELTYSGCTFQDISTNQQILNIDVEYDAYVYTSKDSTDDVIYLQQGSPNVRSLFRFPLTNLPSNATVLDVDFQGNVNEENIETSDQVNINAYNSDGQADPEVDATATAFSRAAGTTLASFTTDFQSLGSKTVDLGETANSLVEAAKDAVDYFSIGFTETNFSGEWITLEAIEDAGNDPATLIITYDASLITSGGRPVLTTVGNTLHMIYQDGNLSHSIYNGSSWTTDNTTIAAVTDDTYSVTTDGTDIWVLSEASSGTATNFYKYVSSSWSSDTAPWTSETNLSSPSITYDSEGDDLYSYVIHDASEQAYISFTDSSTISWSAEESIGFTAGDLGELSSSHSVSDRDQAQAVIRQGENFEFSDFSFNTAPTITNNPSIDYGSFTRTGPNNTPFSISFTATDPEETGADELTYDIRTGAGASGGTSIESGTFDSGVEEVVNIAYNATGLSEGSNTLYLYVTDGTDEAGTNPNTTLLRDDTNPTSATSISHTPDPIANGGTQYTVTFTPNDAFSTSADEIAYSICTGTGGTGCTLASGTGTDESPETTSTITDTLSAGPNTRYIRQCDGANNCADTSFTVTVNDLPTVTGSPVVSYGSFTRTGPNNTPFTVTFTATDGQQTGADELTYYIHTAANRTGTLVGTGTFDSGVEEAPTFAYNASGLAEGSNTLYLSVYDGTDYDATNPSFTVLRDDTNPSSATLISHTPDPVSDVNNQYTVTFTPHDTTSTSSDEITYSICTSTGGSGCTLSSGTATDDIPETTGTITDASLTTGSNTRYIRQCDGANNCADTSFTVTLNSGPSITDGPDVDYGLYTRTGPNNTPFTISFTATDGQETGANGLTYYIHTGANRTGTQIATGTMTSGIEKVASIAYNTAGLSSGSNTLYLSIYDGVDYSANPNFTVLRDDAAPTSATSISTNPSPVSVGSNQYKVTFTPNDTLSTSVNEIRFWICTGTGGIGCTLATGTATDEAPEQTSTIVDSLSIGSNTRYVRQCDGANNCADTSFTVTGTEAPPDIILDGNIIIDGDVEL